MSRRSRILVLIASIALAVTYIAPLWRIDLTAPQYPEGLGMRIGISDITGASEWDLKKVNQLNHYIGMQKIEPDSIRELELMPWIVAVLVIGGLLTAAFGRRRALHVWVAVFAIAAVAGMADFWRWEYDYGHNLDPAAPIRIPGMSYQPPLIGSKQILNFTASAWPATGGWFAIAAFGLALGALALDIVERKRRRDGKPALSSQPDRAEPARTGLGSATTILLVAIGTGLVACSPRPVPIVYGEDQGDFCRMTITDERYGAELVTRRGRVYKFDSVECLAGFVLTRADSAEIHSAWVTDFGHAPTLIRADEAMFLRSRDLRGPMGGNLTAFGDGITREALTNAFYGELLSWQEVLDHERVSMAAGGNRAPESFATAERNPVRAAGDGAVGSAGAAPGESGVVHVSPAGPIRSIGEAVAMAAPGGRIVVEAGTYREPTIVVDRPLVIEGSGRPTLDGEGERQILVITADDVTVRGLVFRHVGTSYVEDRAAVRVENARRCRIESNEFDDTFFGVYLASATDCVIAGNVMRARGKRETASGNGIHLWYSRNVEIRGNDIRGHRDGIYMEFVRRARVEGNTSANNLRYGLHFMFSDTCEYINNTFRENGAGVAVMYTKQVVMRDNLFDHNWGTAAFGLLLKDIADSEVEGNVFRTNSVGLYAEGTNRVSVTGNIFERNGWALKLMANSVGNEVTRNDFTGNTFDVATNSRQSYSVFRENYWDAYRGYDLDRDGYGDVPFRPVRLFSSIVAGNEASLILLRSLLVATLDAAERVLPAITPAMLADARPAMRPHAASDAQAATSRSIARAPGGAR